MQIENDFEKETGFKIKELRYLKPPKLPYLLYQNKKNYRGADLLNNIIENNIIIERYSETDNEEDLKDKQKVDKFINKYFKGIEFESQTEWLSAESLYGAFWVIEPVLEKIRKDKY